MQELGESGSPSPHSTVQRAYLARQVPAYQLQPTPKARPFLSLETPTFLPPITCSMIAKLQPTILA